MSFVKRIAKIFGIVVASILAVVLLTFAVISIPAVQTKLIRIAENKISSAIGLTVSVGGVSPMLWDGVALRNVYVFGEQNDTILSAEYLSASVNAINLDSSSFALSKITLSQPRIRLVIDSLGTFNIDPLLQNLSSDDTTSNVRLSVDEVFIRKASFYFDDMTAPFAEKGMDFSHLQVDNLYASISNFVMENGSYSASIQKFSAQEKSGFKLSYLFGDVQVTDTIIDCSDVAISATDSKVYAKHFSLSYTDFSDFSDFCEKVAISANVNHSSVSLHDVSYFAPVLEQMPYRFTIHGDFEGTVSDFVASDIHIGYGKSSQLVGMVEAQGLPDLDKTKFRIQAQNLSVNSYDISHTLLPFQEEEKYVELPSVLDAFSFFKFTGTVSGTTRDASLVGTLLSDAGKIDADVRMVQNKTIACDGSVTFKQFDCSYLLSDSDILGKISGSVLASVEFNENSFLNGTLKGIVDTLECNGYAYKSIDLDTRFSSERFGGKVSINDANLKMNFAGGLDFSVKTPEIKFISTIEKANLDKLNLFSDSLSSVSFSTQVDLYGADLDDLNGIASIRNLEYSNAKGTVSTKNIAVNFSNEKQQRNIALRSAFADAEINGQGSYGDLYNNILALLGQNISALPYNKDKGNQTSEFTFSATVKNIDTVFSLLFPDLRIKNGTTCSAVYSKEKNTASIDIHSPRCSYGSVAMYNGDISLDCDETGILVNSKCTLDSDSKSGNTLMADCSIVKDSLSMHTAWSLASALKTHGECAIRGAMQTKQIGELPKFVLTVIPSQFYLADSLWNIAESHLVVDTTSISISGFCLSKDAKKIHVDGVISENSNDYVVVDVENYDLRELNPLIGNENVRLAGQIEGRVRMKNLYATPLVFADINSGLVSFNDNELGSLRFRSFWENKQKALLLKAIIMREKDALLSVEGKYVPSSDSLRCTVACNDLDLKIFDEILQGTVDRLSGIVNGNVDLNGTLSYPTYSGELEATNGSFTVSYLNVPYKFSGKLRAQKTRFLFSDFTIEDSRRNTGEISGFVDIKDLGNPHYRIDISSPKILVMNTTAKDNDYFYGTIYYNGTAKIEGDLNETDITANGRSLENTVCSIPVSYSELSGVYDFLSFDVDTTIQVQEKTTTSSGMTMNMTLSVTPDALAQIVFDPKVGDVIKARGNGDLQVKMDKDGDLQVYGKYQIDEGEYLFTLKNLINKKLVLQKGGTIAWNGDPLNAQVNLTANYETKASPQPLFDSSVSATKRIPVTCKAMLQNNLMSPDISYDIAVPSSATQVSEVLSTLSEDEKTLQFLSLMLQGSFMAVNSSAVGGNSVSFEVLSNQINNLLSQLDPNLNVNVNYRLGTDNVTNNEFEFGISRQFWNDRILVNVNGYTDFGGANNTDVSTTAQANEFSGNVSVEMKVNKQGTLKVKGFSRSNDDELSEKQENTNGLGFSFTKDFNVLREFFRKEK